MGFPRGMNMNTRNKSLIAMLFIYVFVVAIGTFLFLMLDQMSLIPRLLIADLAMTMITWIISLILKNASVYDPYWSVVPPLMILGVILFLNQTFSLSTFLLFTGVLIWGVRLTYNWLMRWTNFHDVDWRYNKIQDKSPKLYFLTNLLAIQLFPTLIVFIQLIVATKFIEQNPITNLVIWIGFVMMVFAAIIQFVADQQMKNFKKRTLNQKLCIEEGLWKYSRHPNYFGEITLWWGIYVMYFGTTMKVDLYIIPAILMTLMFLFVSIPWMEKKIIKTRPEYKDYQKNVSMLIPFLRYHK